MKGQVEGKRLLKLKFERMRVGYKNFMVFNFEFTQNFGHSHKKGYFIKLTLIK